MQSVQLQYGWLFLIIGAVLIIATATIKGGEINKKVNEKVIIIDIKMKFWKK